MAAAPQQQAQDTLGQSHRVAQGALQMAGNVLSKAHDTAMAPPQAHPDIMAALAALHSKVDQGQQGAPGQGGDSQQAVWDAFPGTDPQNVSQLGQTGDPNSVMEHLFAIFSADEQKLQSLHQQALESLVNMMGAPQGQSEPIAPPAVGGEQGGGGY